MMAIEHLKALKDNEITFTPWRVEDRTVSGATRNAVFRALVWEIPKGQDITWKSVTTVAKETQNSRRQVHAAIRSLVEESWLELLPKRGRSRAYRVRQLRPQVTHSTPEPETSGHTSPNRSETSGHPSETSGHRSETSGHPMGSMGTDGTSTHTRATAEAAAKMWAGLKNITPTRTWLARSIPKAKRFLEEHPDLNQSGVESFIAWAASEKVMDIGGWSSWWTQWPGAKEKGPSCRFCGPTFNETGRHFINCVEVSHAS